MKKIYLLIMTLAAASSVCAQFTPPPSGYSALTADTNGNVPGDFSFTGDVTFATFDIGSFQLLSLGVPKLDWGLGKVYGPTGLPDPRLDWEARILGGTWTADGLLTDSLSVTNSIDLPGNSIGRPAIAPAAVGPTELDELGAYTVTSIELTEMLSLTDIDVDPADPVNGGAEIWLSSGAGSGDAGDLLVKIRSGGTTSTFTLVDFAP